MEGSPLGALECLDCCRFGFGGASADTGSANGTILSYRVSAGKFTLTWPITGDRFLPEYTDSLVSPNWIPLLETPSTAGDNSEVTVLTGETMRFFRLRRQ